MSNIQLAKQVFYKVGDEKWDCGFPVKSKEVNGELAYGVVKEVGGDIFWCYAKDTREIDGSGEAVE